VAEVKHSHDMRLVYCPIKLQVARFLRDSVDDTDYSPLMSGRTIDSATQARSASGCRSSVLKWG